MVKAGYKETEIGVIPEDWEVDSIYNKCEILNGLTYRPADVQSHGLLVLRSSNIQNGRLDFSDTIYVNKDVNKDKMIKAGDILVCVRNGSRALIGKSVLIEADYHATFGAFMSLLRSCTNRYINHIFNSCLIQHQIDSNCGATINQITKKDFKHLKFPIPLSFEQEKIAKALSDADNLIFSLEKLIEKKKAIKQGAMQQLLNENSKAKNVAFGKLGIKIQKGESLNTNGYQTGNIPVIAGGKKAAYFCNRANRIGTTITISASGASAGYVNIHNGEIFASDCSTISQSLNYDIRYIYYLLKNKQYTIYMSQTGGAQPHIKPKDIEKIKLPYIDDTNEQTAIADILSDMDNEISALEKKLHKYRQVKQGMMQELLTGRIRLVTPDTKETAVTQTQPKGHNQKFDDAVVIGAIVNAFYSDTYTLGRKKVQKLLYFFRRKQNASVDDFKKKAAGPYADEVRYKGGEPIAIQKQYVKAIKTPKGTKFEKGEGIDGALHYINKWEMRSDLDWLVKQFKYIKTDKLELLATIDMAMQDLKNESIAISVATVKELIRGNKEWKAKLSKSYFSDEDIAWAIEECGKLFKTEE